MTLLTPNLSARLTPEDLLSIPDNGSMELVDGQIVEKNVSMQSSRVEGRFLTAIQNFLNAHPIAEVFPQSLGYTCFPDQPGKVRRPDVTVVSRLRLSQLSSGDVGYMPIVPDLAIEVISPNDVTYEIDKKIREYQEAGFPLIWVADPEARSIVVYPLKRRPAIFTDDDELAAEDILPGFRCKVRDFFPVSAAAPLK